MQAQELLKRIGQNLSVQRAFGTAYEKDGFLIIPAALVAGGGGGGEDPMMASGGVREPDAASEKVDSNPVLRSPTGFGAGSGGVVIPVGVYVVDGEDVRWSPPST